MSKETRRCFSVIRQKLDACFIMKHNDLVYRKGKKKQFDDLVENMVKLLKKARKLNTRAMGEMYEGPSLRGNRPSKSGGHDLLPKMFNPQPCFE